MALDPARAAVRAGVRRVLDEAALEPGTPVVVACSGGADSLALLAATVFESRAHGSGRGLHVVAATVDHGLQDGSAELAERVVAQAAGLGADETVAARVSVHSEGQGVEAAAREARYDVLAQVAQRWSAPLVLLGHTRDDQAETVLLGLTRGSGARSLAGMRRGFDVFARPLLDVTRAQTEAACRAEGLDYWEDPHNTDQRFTRARVRHRVLPILEAELGPGVAAALARTADQLTEDAQALDAYADAAFRAAATDEPAGAVGVRLDGLAGLPTAVRTRVLRRAALAAGCPGAELFRVHVQALDRLAADPDRAAKQVQLPGRVTARCGRDSLTFVTTPVGG
ncbi:tRNA lysidine(34) synthetase TilS [Nocardioides massiliensis]|uniref:tRNA(Ile)-lysidine synthase n=1 Tax=Nocardioides massiliensis TaxID=1325935 RepID=A0ABT9NKD7_9ACTN|nr:tRNA lysidine(34) synthetase TilS [Nocardioides massiliensis]MDP9820884.1 tRNA(Ile)-lysidine synthase [Nocardioides massiliensis]